MFDFPCLWHVVAGALALVPAWVLGPSFPPARMMRKKKMGKKYYCNTAF
jgi:hypothetical protein